MLSTCPLSCGWAPPTWAGRLFSLAGRSQQYLQVTRAVHHHEAPTASDVTFLDAIGFDAKSTNGRKNFLILGVLGSSLIFCLGRWGLSFRQQFLQWHRPFMRLIMSVKLSDLGYRLAWFALPFPSHDVEEHSSLW